MLSKRLKGVGIIVKNRESPIFTKKRHISAFQIIVITLVAIFLIFDILMVEILSPFGDNFSDLHLLLNSFCIMQILLSCNYIAINYLKSCEKFRDYDWCYSDGFVISPKIESNLETQISVCSGVLPIIGGFASNLTLCMPAAFYGSLAAATTTIAALIVFLFKPFKQDHSRMAAESQFFWIDYHGNSIYVAKRGKFIKRFLQVLFFVYVGICIYFFHIDCSVGQLNSLNCFISIFIARVSSHYTVLNVMAFRKKSDIPDFSFFSDSFYVRLGTYGVTFITILIWIMFCSLSTKIYFLAAAILVLYTLILDRYGRYPFIDYELLLVDLVESSLL